MLQLTPHYTDDTAACFSRQSARAFLESRDGFAAAGKRATTVGRGEGGWQAKASADPSFTAQEKQRLGLIPDSTGNSTSAAQSTWPYSSSAEDDAVREAAGGNGVASSTTVDGVYASSLSSASHPTSIGVVSNEPRTREREVAGSESCDKPQEVDPSLLSKTKLEDERNPEPRVNRGDTLASPSNGSGGEHGPLPTAVPLTPAACESSDIASGTVQGEIVVE